MSEPSRRAVAVGLLSLLAAIDGAAAATDRGPAGPFGWLAGSLRDRVLDVVDPDEVVERLDINAVLERVDINAVLERVEIDPLLARVDANALLERVDPDLLLAHIDLDALIARVDVNAVFERVDVDAVMERVDIERLIQRAGIPDIVAESTTSLLERTLDVLRRQLLGVDVVLARAITRLLSRDPRSLPTGPEALVGDESPTHAPPMPDAPTEDVNGHYAGPVTRLAAFVIDVALVGGSFTIVTGALGSVLRTVGVGARVGGAVFSAAAVAWLFTYWWASTAVAGRTPGMAIIGLRIVTRAGAPLSGRRAFVRVLSLPLSFVLLGLGLLGILLDRERRALHDLLAGSTVVYDWGDRMATMPTPLARWLEQRAAPIGATSRRQSVDQG
ncbi:MAG TPA: RDD family protein [Euzebyales bacterium]|nr:RDD family protein [Euzebyales bacterium]